MEWFAQSCLLCEVLNSNFDLATDSEILCGLPQSFQSVSGIVRPFTPQSFLSNILYLIIL